MAKDDKEIEPLDQFKKDLANDADLADEQREKANEDMRFVNVSMWDDFTTDNDINVSNTNNFDRRTKLELDIVSNYKNRFIGEWNQNRIGVEYKADDDDTSDDDAELLNSIYRADFRQFSGKMAIDNAVDEVATCGYGAYRIAAKFEDEGDPENDNQRIEWQPIHNAYSSVYWDMSAKRIDKRDARRCTELIRFTKESFEEAYPGKVATSAYEPDDFQFQNSALNQPDFVFIGKRYEIIRKKESVFIYNNLETSKVEVYDAAQHEKVKDELQADELRIFVRERKIIQQHIERTVFSGDDILEDTRRIAGKWIPIIPLYAYHSYVDGLEYYYGLVRKLKDAGRLFNMQVSQLAENAASNGQEVPIFTTEQMTSDAIKNIWADKNNKPYLVVDPVYNQDGTIAHMGPIGYSKPAQLDQSTTTLMQIVPAYVQDVTGGVPQDTLNPDISGKAINALIKRENLNTQTVNDNISNAIEWSGEVYMSMAVDGIYTVERMINTIGLDGTEGRKQLMKTVLDEETGQTVTANNLNGKRFRAYADVGPQYDSMREQTVEDLKGMLESLQQTPNGQQYTPAVLALIMDNIVGVGLGPLKELNRRIMLLQGLVKPETDEEKALVAQAQQPKEDPNAELTAAVTQQQISESRNLDTKSAENIAGAELKSAQTRKAIAETEETLSNIDVNEAKIENDTRKTLMDIRNFVIKPIEGLPIQ